MKTQEENKQYAISSQHGTKLAVSGKKYYSYRYHDLEQIRAIEASLPTMVLGAAGTGKKRTILHRIAKAVTEDNLRLDNIFVCSPTLKIAKKMADNITHFIGGEAEYEGTIHSNAVELLRNNPVLLTIHGYDKNFELIDDTGFDTLLAETLKPDAEYLRTKFNISRHKAKKYLRAGIKSLKNKGFYSIDMYESPAEVSQNNILRLTDGFGDMPADIAYEIYQALQKKMKQENLLDFQDLIALPTFAMRDIDIRYNVNKQFKLVIIDRFQDFSILQFEMAEYLAHDGKYLYLVGDESQFIDDWDTKSLRSSIAHYREAAIHKVFLKTNYRSQAYIASLAVSLRRVATPDEIQGIKFTNPAANKVLNLVPLNTKLEAQYIKESIEKLICSGVKANEIAVIARVEGYLQTLEDVLISHEIDYYFEKNTNILEYSDEAKRNKVQLMTVHGSRGLEFKHVFIIGAVDKLFPLKHAKPKAIRSDKSWKIILEESERRLFYVAVSRARETLTILSPIYVHKSKAKHVRTMFLDGLDEYVETKPLLPMVTYNYQENKQ